MRVERALAEHSIEAPPGRFVLVHYHIFKNGGTMIESILHREFGDGFARLHGEEDGSVLDSASLAAFLREHREVQAVSSHHLLYPKPAMRGLVTFDCCFLRHPFDRLISVYNQTSLQNPLRREPLRDFVKRMLDESPHLLSDVQVNRLVNGGAFVRPADERDLEKALQVLREMAVPGVVDLFDESLVSAEYFLKPAFPALQLHYLPENVSRPARQNPADVQYTELWGTSLHSDLVRLNQMDLELYRRARMEVLRRFALVPRRAERLERFRERSAALNGRLAATGI